jgi:uncharacterized protein (DUF433 family)
MKLPEFLTEDRNGFIHFSGHRVGLEHLVYYYNGGYSAEMLACEYPTLGLPVIHKVIAFYLENRDEVDRYVARGQAMVEQQRRQAEPGPSLAQLRQRLAGVQDTGTPEFLVLAAHASHPTEWRDRIQYIP